MRLRGLVCGALCAPSALGFGLCRGASAATFTAGCSGTTGDTSSLLSAIDQANSGFGADTVELVTACVYTVTAANNNWYGPNGLPAIKSDITIEGHGATIARSPVAPKFRLFFVAANPFSSSTPNYVVPPGTDSGGGQLTLRDLTLGGGLAKGGDSNRGGGGAGMGGAIFSQGKVTIDRSAMTGNIAQGGASTSTSPSGDGGGGIGTNENGSGDGGGFGSGSFGGGFGGSGSALPGAGGGAGFASGENGASATNSAAGAGGGPLTGTGGHGGGSGASGGDGSGGGADVGGGNGSGGSFGGGGPFAGGGGGVGGGGGYGSAGGGGGGFGGGGGAGGGSNTGGDGGFGGGSGAGGGGAGGFGGGRGTLPTSTYVGGGGAGLGGAIFNMQGQLTILDSTLTANQAVAGSDGSVAPATSYGGAVFNLNGSFTAGGSTFAANTVTWFGGPGSLSPPPDGASIYSLVYDAATARTAQTTLRDTIVAKGNGGVDLVSDKPASVVGFANNQGSAGAAVGEFDLVQTMTARQGGTISGSPLTADPMLGPLQANGGPTATMALANGSPAIDAGDPGCLDVTGVALGTDQRGALRPASVACDIGAFEVATPRATTGPPSNVALTSATLTGVAGNPDLAGATTFFQYGPTTSYGSSTAAQAINPATAQVPVTAPISGLAAGMRYHFRTVAMNGVGTSFGADQTFMTTSLPGVTPLIAIARVSLSPTAFPAAPSGPSAVAAKRRFGTKVSYVLNEPGTVRFTVVQPRPGRKAHGRRCVKPTKANRRASKCTRLVQVHGSFSRAGTSGTSRFRFTGRVGGRKLKLGGYQLVATPTAAGKSGRAARAPFRIVK